MPYNKFNEKSAKNRLGRRCLSGLLSLPSHPQTDELLYELPVENIRGIGRQYGHCLRQLGIENALQLKNASDYWLRKNLSANGFKTAMELRGVACLNLEETVPARHSLITSRSFARLVTDLEELKEAITAHTAKAGEKLQEHGLSASFLQVFIFTDPFRQEPQYSNYLTIQLPPAGDSTPELVKHSGIALERIYKAGYRYKQAGITLLGLVDSESLKLKLKLFEEAPEPEEAPPLIAAVDRVNARFGPDTIRLAVEGGRTPWRMIGSRLTTRYATDRNETPEAKA